jgi:uncharacterized membrane protein YheB (UPF0754 family)
MHSIHYKLLRLIISDYWISVFDNVILLEASYETKMGENLLSKLVYTHTDPLENHLKKVTKIISEEGLKQTVITYSSRPEDIDKNKQ